MLLGVMRCRHVLPVRDRMMAVLLNATEPSLRKFKAAYPGIDPQYQATLCDSVFAATPSGNVHDTWRLNEALECGAIPIVTDGGE